MLPFITAPALVRRAAGLKPFSNTTATFDTFCSLCGVPISRGDPCSPREITSIDKGTFLDHPYMANRHGGQICEDCPPLMGKDFLQKYANALVTEDGLFKLSSNEEIASFLLSPPETPFVVTISNAKQQHVFWRAPLNLDGQLFRIQFGPSVYSVRHETLMHAASLQRKLLATYADIISAGKKKAQSTYKSAIIIPDRKMKGGGNYGILQKIGEAAGETGEFKQFESVIRAMYPGELWALATIGYSGLTEPKPLLKLLPAQKQDLTVM